MKNIVILSVLISFSVIFFPLGYLSGNPRSESKTLPVSASVIGVEDDLPSETLRLYRKESKTVETINTYDYLCGVLAAEMPATYEPEALKAQAVAAYGFALYRKETRSGGDYDVSDDYTTDQSYIPLEEAQAKWGEKAAEYTEKIKAAIDAVEGKKLTYEGKTALTVYHALSSGKTNSCKDVWGSDVPYLKSVDSSFDKSAPDYQSTVSLTPEEVAEKLGALKKASGDPQSYFGKPVKNKSGRVMKIDYCGAELTGAQISKALCLRSSSFDVSYRDSTFTFTVFGYGHGVGMSQNGANCMAKQGSTFKEILYHYYPGCILN